MVDLSLVLPLGYRLGFPHSRSVLGSLFGYLTDMILGMSLVSNIGSLLYFIWHTNGCGPWLGAWKFL